MKSKLNTTKCRFAAAGAVVSLVTLGCGGNGGAAITADRATGPFSNSPAFSTSGINTAGPATGASASGPSGTGAIMPESPTTKPVTYSWVKNLFTETLEPILSYSHGGCFIASNSNGTKNYFGASMTTTNAQLQLISSPAGGQGYPYLVNDYGKMAGSVYYGNTIYNYFWTNPTTPVRLKMNPNTTLYSEALCNTGAIAAYAVIYNTPYLVVIPTPTSRPLLLEKLGPNGVSYVHLSISDGGFILARGCDKGVMLFKPPYNTPGIVIKGPDGKTSPAAQIGQDGVVYGYDSTTYAYYYSLGPNYNTYKFIGTDLGISDINSRSQLCGWKNNGGGNNNWTEVWPGVTSNSIGFYNIGDPGFQPIQASYIFNNGDIVVQDDYGNSTYAKPSGPI